MLKDKIKTLLRSSSKVFKSFRTSTSEHEDMLVLMRSASELYDNLDKFTKLEKELIEGNVDEATAYARELMNRYGIA